MHDYAEHVRHWPNRCELLAEYERLASARNIRDPVGVFPTADTVMPGLERLAKGCTCREATDQACDAYRSLLDVWEPLRINAVVLGGRGWGAGAERGPAATVQQPNPEESARQWRALHAFLDAALTADEDRLHAAKAALPRQPA